MSSVTNRIEKIKQPRGGYVKPSMFEITAYDDGINLYPEENIHATYIGMAVDYLTRFSINNNLKDAFQISIMGALRAEKLGIDGASDTIIQLLKNIKGLDDTSIINACKAVSFDTWYRNPRAALISQTSYKNINPDDNTIQNIKTLVNRSIGFFEKYGPITKDGFDFLPPNANKEGYINMKNNKCTSYGGYTPTVDTGDGDFLTHDTLWDLKVLRSELKIKHTLQLLMYWIMGQHSGQDIFKNISKLGIFNPRYNYVYLLEVAKIPKETISIVEKEVIGY